MRSAAGITRGLPNRPFLGERRFFGPRCLPKARPLPRASSQDLASPAPCADSRPFTPSDTTRDTCASTVALLLRQRSPRPSQPPPTSTGVHASACHTLSSSRGARGRRRFAGSLPLGFQARLHSRLGPGRGIFTHEIYPLMLELGHVFVVVLQHRRVNRHLGTLQPVIFPSIRRI